MLFVGEVVKPSGRGRTATWEGMAGTVTQEVEGKSVFVQWHNVAVEDELDCEELVSTNTFNKTVPHHVRVLNGSDEDEDDEDEDGEDGEDDNDDHDDHDDEEDEDEEASYDVMVRSTR
jgi:hypothetical protein